MINRVTHVFGEEWAIITGGVPSGAFNTSHMDSFTQGLYLSLFFTHQVATAPPEDQEELERMLLSVVRMVVYGDDHLYRKGFGKAAHYFSGQQFAAFMKKHFDVVIRDVKDGIPFCSIVKDGWVQEWGATLLKHQIVENPHVGPMQPDFLPYRESREFLIRAVYGRETRSRDEIDTLLSIVGHAYGTYGSNKDAYDRLYLLYSELLMTISDKIPDVPKLMMDRISHDDLKKLRQAGLTAETLVSGFPSMQSLIDKNQVDLLYQDISGVPLDLNDQVAGYEEFDSFSF
jgi:hypothetical protein